MWHFTEEHRRFDQNTRCLNGNPIEFDQIRRMRVLININLTCFPKNNIII